MNKTGVFLALLAALLFPARPAAAADKAPLAVTVSIAPLKYFAEAVGGDKVAVTVMAGKGRDPHSYEPTAAEMMGLAKAEIYFTIGVPFETQWLPRFQSLNPSMRVVALLEAVDRIHGKPDLALRDTLPGKERDSHDLGHQGHHHEHGLETDDPHAWLSPDAMMKTIPLIVTALADKRPEYAAEFSRRGEELARDVTDLGAAIRSMLALVTDRTFLTFHQSWAYYARDFSLREASVELEGREPGPKSMAMLMDFAKENNVRVIVADSMASKSAVQAIARNMGARVVMADPLAEDWPAALRKFSRELAEALQGAK